MDFGTIDMPLPSKASIIHRLTGVFLVAGTAVLLYLLGESLSGQAQFDSIKQLADSTLCRLVVFVVLASLIFHVVAGVKHLIMDMGIGETLEGGITGARLVFIVSFILILLMGAWIW